MRSTLVVTSVGIHIAVVAGMLVLGFWKLDKLDAPRQTFDLAVAPPLPAAAASGSPSAHAEPFKKKRRKVTLDVVQPTKPDPETKPLVTGSEPGSGTGGTGSGAGSGSGSDPKGTGSCTEEPCGPQQEPEPIKVPKIEGPTILPPTVFKGLRISGDTQIQPPPNVKTAIMRDGKTKVIATYRVCVGPDGGVSSLTLLKSSGYSGYDSALDAGLRQWRYKPYEIGGRKVTVCSVVTFIYAIH